MGTTWCLFSITDMIARENSASSFALMSKGEFTISITGGWIVFATMSGVGKLHLDDGGGFGGNPASKYDFSSVMAVLGNGARNERMSIHKYKSNKYSDSIVIFHSSSTEQKRESTPKPPEIKTDVYGSQEIFTSQ